MCNKGLIIGALVIGATAIAGAVLLARKLRVPQCDIYPVACDGCGDCHEESEAVLDDVEDK